jgi:acetylglutamate kinase
VAAGLSGKDGKTVTAIKRHHVKEFNGSKKEIDLGRVGDVAHVDPTLIMTLLKKGFIPVIACIADDENGVGFNINGDLFAGHIAGALKAEQYIVLTDVNGLQKDKDDPGTLIRDLRLADIQALIDCNIIQGGMIPKINSCQAALNKGVKKARIINGTKPEDILKLMGNISIGTTITSP